MTSSTRSFAPIAADSLSSLTSIASDPPLRPRQSANYRREPLVLYIARVPGRREQDVFLTPLKPRSKTVTAEDVESCLYYLHFDSPEDVELLDEPATHPENEPPGLGHKPLPPLPDRRSGAQTGSDSLNTIRRKPVGHAACESHVPETPPLPPRPIRPGSSRANSNDSIPSITIVRRDPSSGTQWNIAKLTDPPVLDVTSQPARNSPLRVVKKPGAPLYIDIQNPGYEKFLAKKPFSDFPLTPSPGTKTPDTLPSLEYSTDASLSSSSASESVVFQRRLWMEGSQFGKGRNKSISTIEYTPNELIQRPSMESRDSNEFSYENQSGTPPVSKDGRLMTRGERRSAVKGYTFISPWNGRCEFGVGTFGSSLKCRHRLPGAGDTTPVSELRFNLPSRPGHKKSSSHSLLAVPAMTPKSVRPRNHKSLSTSQIETEEFWDDDDERLDLSLGQELAGGGATGKLAKLGKLILEDEGMKMMDLVVAANMALWWRAYERVGSENG